MARSTPLRLCSSLGTAASLAVWLSGCEVDLGGPGDGAVVGPPWDAAVGDAGGSIGGPLDAAPALDASPPVALDAAPSDATVPDAAPPDASVDAGADAAAPPPVCSVRTPSVYTLDTRIGGGGAGRAESAHFAVYGAAEAQPILDFMEAAHRCFVDAWCFRTPGLSVKSDASGPYVKTNIYVKSVMSAGGLTHWDASAQLAYIDVLARQAADPLTTVHEYGHAVTMSEASWIDQKRTGFWWESVANWFAYTFMSAEECAGQRAEAGVKPLTTIVDGMRTLTTVYGLAHTVICNDQNYYQAWPLFTYLTNNPDRYPGLGKNTVLDLMRKYARGSNETPLHTLARLSAPVTVQTILGRYWARMAYMDIGLPIAQKDFLASRASLGFAANWDAAGTGRYTVKAARRPQYGGANITPLRATATTVEVVVNHVGTGRPESGLTATLAIRAASGTVRYVDLPGGRGQAALASGDELSLVVVNTPSTLYLFDPERVSSPENLGLDYAVELRGAVPAG
jgi:Family of unknown function (DUF6055)